MPWVWTILFQGHPGYQVESDWLAAGYPFAFLALFGAGAGALSRAQGLAAAVVLAASFVTSVAVVTTVCGWDLFRPGYELPVPNRVGEVLSALALVGAHLFYEQGLRRRLPRAFVGAVSLFVLGVVMHASVADLAKGREAFYHASGMTAVLATTSCLLRLPDVARPTMPPGTLRGLAASLVLALLGAAIYFNRFVFPG